MIAVSTPFMSDGHSQSSYEITPYESATRSNPDPRSLRSALCAQQPASRDLQLDGRSDRLAQTHPLTPF